MVSLVSMATGSFGMEQYVEDRRDTINPHLIGVDFAQGDIVHTLIKCENGETVTMTLDTCLPRYYSRGFTVHGTKGLICEENSSVYLEDEFTSECWEWQENYNNVQKYYDKYKSQYYASFW